MTESVDKALDRSMKLDDLAEKSGEVHVQAMNWATHTTKLMQIV